MAVGDLISARGFALHANNAAPEGIGIHADGRCFVADASRRSVFIYQLTATGATFLVERSVSAQITSVGGAFVAGDVLYVMDRGDDTVEPYAIGGSGAATTLTHQGSSDFSVATQVDLPRGGAESAGGFIYVLDQDNRDIEVYTSAGAYQSARRIALPAGSPTKYYTGLGGTRTGQTGRLYITENGADEVYVYSVAADGTATRETADEWDLDAANAGPHGVAIHERYAYVIDKQDDEVYVYEAVAPVAGAPTLSTAETNADGTAVILTFNKALDSGHVPPAGAFAVVVAGSARAVSGVSISGAAVTLTLASAVTHGQAVTVAYTKPVA